MWGRPNSVTIIDSSAQMAADVEFANFLTRKYFEKTSATLRKSMLFPIEHICLQCVPWERRKLLSSAYDWL